MKFICLFSNYNVRQLVKGTHELRVINQNFVVKSDQIYNLQKITKQSIHIDLNMLCKFQWRLNLNDDIFLHEIQPWWGIHSNMHENEINLLMLLC